MIDKKKLSVVRWDITSKCNFNCSHCYASSLHRSQSSDLSLEEVQVGIKNLGDPGVSTVMFYGGEPLYRDDIVKVVEACTEQGIQTYITTNGYLLDKKYAALVQAGLRGFGVSLDGATEDVYAYIRGGNRYEQVIANFKELSKLHVASRVIVMVLMKENATDASKMIRLARDLDATGVIYEGLAVDGNALVSKRSTPLEPGEYVRVFESIVEETLRVGFPVEAINLRMAPPKVVQHLNSKYNVGLDVEQGTCRAGMNSVFIDSRGLVFPCRGVHPRMTIKTGFKLKGLSVVQNTLHDILRSDEFSSFFMLGDIRKTSNDLVGCRGCSHLFHDCHPCPIAFATQQSAHVEGCINYPLGAICQASSESGLNIA